MNQKKKIYFDYAASTPLDARVLRTMQPYFGEKFGNASSLHSFGQEARAAVDASREVIAHSIGAQFDEVIFVGSATEANNLAMRGVVAVARKEFARPRVILSSIEHDSIEETVRELEKGGVEVVRLPVDREGRVSFQALRAALTKETVLVSIMYANNEIGTVEPISECAKTIREFRGEARYPLFHVDAVQAFQFFDCNVDVLGVGAMTLSAHKIYGPKGVGALYVRGGRQTFKKMTSIVSGGGQEFGMRSGTENVAVIVGFAEAVKITEALRTKEAKRIERLRLQFLRGFQKIYPKAEVNGASSLKDVRGDTLPSIVSVYLPDFLAQDFMVACDLRGVAISTGSACSMGSTEPSRVILAIGHSKDRALRSVRFSFGRGSTTREVARALSILRDVRKRARF